MGEMRFTTEQQKVITTRNRNLLVSAAAGSGKTAVLVERIIQMVIDKDNPIDIDQLLVVTFTNAAASEMRERIGDAIEKKLEENPEDRHLQRQLAMLSSANIMTVHAFCIKILKNHFNAIGLDPSFKIGDENELALIKKDVIEELLEKKYRENEEEFIDFIECHAGPKSDTAIEELILNCYRFAVSNPWPKDWLKKNVERLNLIDSNEFFNSEYYQLLIKATEEKMNNLIETIEDARKICLLPDGPIHYLDAIITYEEYVSQLSLSLKKGYESVKNTIDTFDTIRLSAKRTGFDQKLKERAKNKIDAFKKELVELKTTYFINDIQDVVSDIQSTYKVLKVLSELTMEFIDDFQIEKEGKGIIDFNDIEHFALDILIECDADGTIRPSATANSYKELFHEILLDEYQDTNIVQETIINAVSKVSIGKPNVFMVGDVKQSIYKFRLAKPELFMDKYNSYSDEESDYQRIYLGKNFRSSPQVVETINFLFKQVMSKNLGDVTYDFDAALHCGAEFPEIENGGHDTELLLLHPVVEDDSDLEEPNIEVDLTERELEAKAIALRIKELVSSNSETQVWDKRLNNYRKVDYKDIVILLRTTSNWTETFLEILTSQGVPVYTDTKTGYFETIEIKTIVNVLQLIDNQRQDIPLVAVLRSPIVGLKGDDLIKIRKCFSEGEMYDALCQYVDGAILEEDELAERLGKFLELLKLWRLKATYLPMDELIRDIFDKTNYYSYMILLPRGAQRQANLDMFIDRAASYEASSYKGLFNFIRYIENIKKYNMDIGEASVLSENDNLVKIMSIHKSKGLEFPIVFVAGLGKNFNKQDLNQSVIFHQDYGFASDYIDYKLRFKSLTLPKIIIKEQIAKELLSEELRVLYVAFTRAKEKLILVGFVKNHLKKLQKWTESLYNSHLQINYEYLTTATNYFDWIMPAIIRHKDARELRSMAGFEGDFSCEDLGDQFNLQIKLYSQEQLYENQVSQEYEKTSILNVLNEWKEKPTIYSEKIRKKLNYEYHYESLIQSKVLMSVSDIKRLQMDDDGMMHTNISRKPKFIEIEEGLTSAQKGTIYHKVMNYLNLSLKPNQKEVIAFLEQLVINHRLTEKEQKVIYANTIVDFLKHPICKRMQEANSSLKRETPFIIGIPTNEMYEGLKDNESDYLMVQGVIDAFFEEQGELVLMDYKTDFIKEGQEAILIERYREQMKYYKRALEQITGKKVKESIIYSLNSSSAVYL